MKKILDCVENLRLERVEDYAAVVEHILVEDHAAVDELERDEDLAAGEELEQDEDLAVVEELELATHQAAFAGPGKEVEAAARVGSGVEAAGFEVQLGSEKEVEHRPQENEEEGGVVVLALKLLQETLLQGKLLDDHMLQCVPLLEELDKPLLVRRQTEVG